MTKKSSKTYPTNLIYRQRKSVKVGEIFRFMVTYTPPPELNPEQLLKKSFQFKVKNVELLPLRAAYLAGPFIIYADVTSSEYDHNKQCFVTAEQPQYNPNIQPGQSLVMSLPIHVLKEKYNWNVDIISQVIFSTTSEVHFEFTIAEESVSKQHPKPFDKNLYGCFSPNFSVVSNDTLDLWNKPLVKDDCPVHLVVVTHGLHSNASADMFYLKELIDRKSNLAGENVIVKGYFGNVCQTERGIKYLGTRLAEAIINEMYRPNVNKISFISHSLGGLVQTFAIGYIQHNYPSFFQKVEPINFISLASPFLGISNENPGYVKMALAMGVVGKTGQDLSLQQAKPLLYLLPTGPTHVALKKFKNRTLYANALHDGIVPLRTSALLFLDWKGLSQVSQVIRNERKSPLKHHRGIEDSPSTNSDPSLTSNNFGNGTSVGKISEDPGEDSAGEQLKESWMSCCLSPIQTVITYCIPTAQIKKKKSRKYRRYQTKDDQNDEQDHDDLNYQNSKGGNREDIIDILPKSSVIESAAKVLLPPLPPTSYIVDPSTRENVIIHDQIYHDSDLPPRDQFSPKDRSISFLESLDPLGRQKQLEELIARKWHKGLTWRKVLVNLLPDAHNNIIVRRKFANAYGWQVLDHLVENHFTDQKTDVQCNSSKTDSESIGSESVRDVDSFMNGTTDLKKIYSQQKERAERDFSKQLSKFQTGKSKKIDSPIISRYSSFTAKESEMNVITNTKYHGRELIPELISIKEPNPQARKDNDILTSDVDTDDDGNWMNESDDNKDGPSGMLNNIGEMVENFKNIYNSYEYKEDELERNDEEDDNKLCAGQHVMGSFY
ncbi:BA75_03438T0 [Komagataella pastoris]|uniref:BA75_03438T0 n=1 Tax=Komagataella pastoris TaxID=4922 RepID=A0A1B2JFM3_PICPA|nr:BA75_03438T0 [Komagataella pastoris]